MSRHPSLKDLEKERPDFADRPGFTFTKTPNTEWKFGEGANSLDDGWKTHKKVSFSPTAEGRPPMFNYKLLIGAVTPRPIAFLSTVSKTGERNLAPFSFFNMVSSDPPVFAIGMTRTPNGHKDSCQNLLDTGEATINIISEWFIEAANSCAIAAPADVDEWLVSGLTPVESEVVKPAHVAESCFSVEVKLLHHYDLYSVADLKKHTNTTVLVQAVQFHAREDVINEELNFLDVAKIKAVSRLGGISYGRTTEGYELPRMVHADEKDKEEFKGAVQRGD